MFDLHDVTEICGAESTDLLEPTPSAVILGSAPLDGGDDLLSPLTVRPDRRLSPASSHCLERPNAPDASQWDAELDER